LRPAAVSGHRQEHIRRARDRRSFRDWFTAAVVRLLLPVGDRRGT
jgi:hypothetical protein